MEATTRIARLLGASKNCYAIVAVEVSSRGSRNASQNGMHASQLAGGFKMEAATKASSSRWLRQSETAAGGKVGAGVPRRRRSGASFHPSTRDLERYRDTSTWRGTLPYMDFLPEAQNIAERWSTGLVKVPGYGCATFHLPPSTDADPLPLPLLLTCFSPANPVPSGSSRHPRCAPRLHGKVAPKKASWASTLSIDVREGGQKNKHHQPENCSGRSVMHCLALQSHQLRRPYHGQIIRPSISYYPSINNSDESITTSRSSNLSGVNTGREFDDHRHLPTGMDTQVGQPLRDKVPFCKYLLPPLRHRPMPARGLGFIPSALPCTPGPDLSLLYAATAYGHY
ncbi:uncharacterized protein CLUP02_03392 [Colletotrichum lupini]|uniref:Uncharacterized protein n=1 Tax=Colletotrichum lupini TaxID=145971 RepID=A0A9Q8WC47_9PEZI|nr:uncharacterized protein CLUP02_03392 [Colletotrichum lupini]UQC77919.1 hypothetical protein CLUP02_03392 [Colletotrichum lupini]